MKKFLLFLFMLLIIATMPKDKWQALTNEEKQEAVMVLFNAYGLINPRCAEAKLKVFSYEGDDKVYFDIDCTKEKPQI